MKENIKTENIFHIEFVTLRDFIKYERDLIVVAGVFLGLSSYFITSYPDDLITKFISGTSLVLAFLLFFQIHNDFNKLTDYEVKHDVDKLSSGVRWFNIFILLLFVGIAVHVFMYYISGNEALQDILRLLLGVFLTLIFLVILTKTIRRRRNKKKHGLG